MANGTGSGGFFLELLLFGSVSGNNLDDDVASLEQISHAFNVVAEAVRNSVVNIEARATLDAQAGWLQSNPDYLAVIEGHADEQGTREHNLALGARRANAVREYLMSRGLTSSRLQTVSYGKDTVAGGAGEDKLVIDWGDATLDSSFSNSFGSSAYVDTSGTLTDSSRSVQF